MRKSGRTDFWNLSSNLETAKVSEREAKINDILGSVKALDVRL